MFLNLLSEESKKAFLELALICARSSEYAGTAESEVLERYCEEMNIEVPKKTFRADFIVDAFTSDRAKFDTEIEEIIESIREDYGDILRAKRIIYFELFAMINADGVKDELEDAILSKLDAYEASKLDMLAAIVNSHFKVFDDIENLYNKTRKA